MTEEKIVEFFNKVKGKKIRWSTWSASDYMVPHTLYREPNYGYYLVGSGVCCGVMDFVMSAYVQMGFDKDDLGNYWDFYELAPHINDNLDDWPLADYLYGLWKLGRKNDFLLSLYGHISYHQCEGHLTAYEQFWFPGDPRGSRAADYCLPSQLVAARAGRLINKT